MVVPTETTVTLDIVSADVIHSWWIPALGGKFQAVPGYHNYTLVQDRQARRSTAGSAPFLCGRGHARMIADRAAVPPAQLDAWLAEQKRRIEAGERGAAKAREKLKTRAAPAAVENQME